MSIYVPAESTERIKVAVAESERRRGERRALRRQLGAARRAGLARRHQEKERRMTETKRRTEPEHEQPGIPEVEAAIPVITDFEQHFRLADWHLQTTVRHLRKLRHLAPAKDALKLVRQAQNLLIDAEDS